MTFVKTALFHKAGEGSGGGGGSDPHNLGFYADLTALQTAHPTGSDGDFAILGSTDTVWVWDSGTSAWKDTDTKGQVTSVNNKTGAVTLGINDVAPTQTGKSGYVLGTDGFVAGWVKPEIVQVSALPAASEDEVDNIYQFVGTTDANYTNGYFYKCVSDGATPAVYSWEAVEVQASSGGLPDQTGQSGKFLTTDGTDASWSDKPLVNTNPTASTTVIIGNNNGSVSSVGNNAICLTHMGSYGGWIALGNNAIAIGGTKNSIGAYSINIGGSSCAGNYAIQLGGNGINSDANTFKVGNANGNFEMMSADGTIPTARLTKVNTAITLAAADWSSNTQTVSISGMTADGVVMVSPDPTDQSAYTSAGVLCTAQAAGTLTFSCDTVPSGDIDVNVVML